MDGVLLLVLAVVVLSNWFVNGNPALSGMEIVLLLAAAASCIYQSSRYKWTARLNILVGAYLLAGMLTLAQVAMVQHPSAFYEPMAFLVSGVYPIIFVGLFVYFIMTARVRSAARASWERENMPRVSLTVGPAIACGVVGAPASGAVASFVLGLLSWFVVWPLGIAAIVLGHGARRRIRESGGVLEGRGYANAGIVLGWIGAVLGFALTAVFVVVLFLVR